jgi:hypothetical protein
MAEYDLDSKNITYDDSAYARNNPSSGNNQLSKANLPINGSGAVAEEGFDWFNMDRWGDALGESLGRLNPLDGVEIPVRDRMGPKKNHLSPEMPGLSKQDLLNMVMMGGSLKGITGLGAAGRNALKSGAGRKALSSNQVPSKAYNQLDELYNKGTDFLRSGKESIGDILKNIYSGGK